MENYIVPPTVMLPCPFCGIEPAESQFHSESLWNHDIVVWHRVYCHTCDIGMNECEYHQRLADRWNLRAK